MKTNKISIKIDRSAHEVFDFTTNPQNTSKWVSSIKVEETTEWPIKIGTVYKNRGEGAWTEYRVIALEQDRLFELESRDENYHVRYTYKDLGDEESEMEYFEWVDKGEIDGPFDQMTLNKLKEVIENDS